VAKDESIDVEGIYIFGGEDANGDISPHLYILRLGLANLSIEPLQTQGVPPIPTRNAKMVRHNKYLIIHGGRNDSMNPSVLNKINFLNLKTLTWV